jgi:hypothetical protein
MNDGSKEWSGGEWQEHIVRLLRARYTAPGMFQEMPSRDKGDLGLEGFSRDGICYQCYAPEPPYDVKDLYEKQRGKITADIGKFIKNRQSLAAVFGELKIKRWLLVVPRFLSTKLLEHCTKKRSEVVEANLPYVDGQFEIGVITESEFEAEACKLASIRAYLHDVSAPAPDTEEVQGFSAENVSLIANIERKAAKLPRLDTPDKISEFTSRMVNHYLRGESATSALRERDPEQFESLLRCKQSKEGSLEIQSMVQTGDDSTLMQTFQEFKIDIQQNVSISPHSADLVAWSAVADWLLRCPLDF